MIPCFGDWFVLPDDIAKFGHPKSTKHHRYFVIREYMGRVVAIPRSGSLAGYVGRAWPAHLGSCGYPSCKIDAQGRLVEERLPPLDIGLFNEQSFSCKESNDIFLEEIGEKHLGSRL